jgi:hypothetical protein
MADDADSFLSRWSRRKAGVRAGVALPAEPAAAEESGALAPAETTAPDAAALAPRETPVPQATVDSAPPAVPPPPTLADVARLTRDADHTPYLAGNVSPEVRNAALRHLFTDPHFNVMDGLDIYVGDYNTPDPLPAGMLRQMVQSRLLGLFDDEDQADPEADATAPPGVIIPPPMAPPPPADPTLPSADENPDLQLQPDDDAGRPGAEPGTGAHAGRPD